LSLPPYELDDDDDDDGTGVTGVVDAIVVVVEGEDEIGGLALMVEETLSSGTNAGGPASTAGDGADDDDADVDGVELDGVAVEMLVFFLEVCHSLRLRRLSRSSLQEV